jgi:copper homeostasis protein
MRRLLEVPLASVEDAAAALQGGAHRLELNAALELGGLTPSLGTFLEIRAAVRLPIVVMIRPRPGGFVYSPAELRILHRDIDLFLGHGAEGIAFGVLDPVGNIDQARCRELVRQIGSTRAIFHRAFDVIPNPHDALEQLIDLGVRRVLTSGQAPTASEGIATLAALEQQAARRIEILPAGGITRQNVSILLTRTGCDQIHASLRTRGDDPTLRQRPFLAFGSLGQTSAEEVAAVRAILDKPHCGEEK